MNYLLHNGEGITVDTVAVFFGPSFLSGNVPAVVVAKQTISFFEAGIGATNTVIVYKVGNPMKSYKSGRVINAINGFEEGSSYYIIPKEEMDLQFFLIPPI